MIEEEDFDSRKDLKKERKILSRTDRSKHKKTDHEKREKKLQEEAERKLAKKNLKRGRVLAISPEGTTIDFEGKKLLCTLSGLLKKEIRRIKNLVTIGDFVLFDPDKLVIAHVEERRSILSRKEHLRQRERQLIAANIDQVLITVSICDPPLKPGLVDRYIIATRKGNMSPIIILNKIDLVEKEDPLLGSFIQTYRALDIPVIPISAQTGEGLSELKTAMKDKTSVFSGQSGVGKSSLINAVTGLKLPTGEVTKKSRKGAHITRTAHLIPLDCGGFCIDTPGIRSFGLWDLQKEDLDNYFPEINAFAKHCHFPDCSHTHEPSCTVLKAVESGEIPRLRYDSYRKLLEEL